MLRIFLLLLSLAVVSCEKSRVDHLTINKPTYRFAVIGDFGNRSEAERWVSDDLHLNGISSVITVEDNIYPNGSSGYESHVGEFFSRWITVPRNNFWPSLGNHDWDGSQGLEPYKKFFHLPRYYDVDLDDRHLIHLCVLDSDPREPDGIDWNGAQAQWFRDAVARNRTRSCFHIVAFHHPAYSTKITEKDYCEGCEPVREMDWPFKEAGIDAVFSGHAHWAERYEHNGMNYWTAGNATDDLDLDNFSRNHHSKFFASVSGYLVGEVDPGWMALGYRFQREKQIRDIINFQKECPGMFKDLLIYSKIKN